MTTQSFNIGRNGCISGVARLMFLLLFYLTQVAVPSLAATVQIDLDRNTAGIQSFIESVPTTPSSMDVLGAVVVTGAMTDTISSNVTQVTVTDIVGGGFTINPDNSTLTNGDIPPSGFGIQSTVNNNDFSWVHIGIPATALGDDGVLVLFNFNLRIINLDSKAMGDTFLFEFGSSAINEALGITVNGKNYSYGMGGFNNPIATTDAAIVIGGVAGPTRTWTETRTKTLTPTISPSRTITLTPTITPSRTITLTPTITPTPTITRTWTPIPTPTITFTPTLTPTSRYKPGICDSGFYLLLTTGQIQRVGNPPIINGGFLFDGDLALDMERAVSNSGIEEKPDLVVLDGSGVTHFVENAGDDIPQDFLFPPSTEFPIGRAVDLMMSRSSEGVWVLTDYGGIYRAGDTKDASENAVVPGTNQMGILGYDIPIGSMRNPNMANPGGASIRAVALVVIDVNTPFGRADGYIVVDSMGAHYCFNPDGTRVLPGSALNAPANDPAKLLDPDPNRGGYVWPYFPGLDIARDAELYPDTQEGLVVFDGWGGIHPVPVDLRDNAVFYTRNEDPEAEPGTLITTVGMPYLVTGFDDPETEQDESDPSNYGADVYSIFQDFEFSSGCPEGGFYTLDKFGAVYTFGSARIAPDWIFPAWRMPYIASQNAQDIELFAAYEGGPTPTPSLTPSSRPTPVTSFTATLTPTETPTETFLVATSTPSSSPTDTMTPTPSESATPTHSLTVTPTETVTMTSTYTATVTLTSTETSTETPIDTVTVTQTETDTRIPTFTFTVTETGTSTVTETPSQTLTSTWTETPFAPTRTSTETAVPTHTSTETATSTFSSTMTETETETSTGTRPPTEPPPTATRTPVFACVQAARIDLVCAGDTSLSAAPFRIKLVPKVDTSVCGATTNTAQPLAIVYVDPASVADENPFDETKFNKGFHCDVALEILGEDISAQLNSHGFVAEMSLPGSVYVKSAVPFSCCLCTDEAGLPCESPNVWPLDVCGLGNLGDGINGNETSFTEGDYSGLTSGLGVICLREECPTPTYTYSPHSTWTNTPTATPTSTIVLSDLPDLKVLEVAIENEQNGGCLKTPGGLGLAVTIVNLGQSYAGTFVVLVNNTEEVIQVIPPSRNIRLWIPEYESSSEQSVLLDIYDQIPEINEENNTFYEMAPIHMPAPTCTVTPTPEFTPTPTSTSERGYNTADIKIRPNPARPGEIVYLDASHSLNAYTFEWEVESSPVGVSIQFPTNAVAYFVAPEVSEPEVITIGLTSVGFCCSPPDFHSVVHNSQNVVIVPSIYPLPSYNPSEPTWTATWTRTPTATKTPNKNTIAITIPGLPMGARPLRMARIPAGSFMMGSPDSERGHSVTEGPVHPVTIGTDFYLGETEVTQAQWRAVMGTNPPTQSQFGVGNDYPVYYASWNSCQAFITALNSMGQGTFRLPCEAEWEYACRGSTSNPERYAPFSFGDDPVVNDLKSCWPSYLFNQYMWWCGNRSSYEYPEGTKPVGNKLPNDYGLYDMHGNVWEWCEDYWHDNYSGAPTNGGPWTDLVGSGGFHVVRGGDSYYIPANCRSAARVKDQDTPNSQHIDVGLRVVMNVPATPMPTHNPSEPTWTQTRTETTTPTPSLTSTPMNLEAITIDIPGLVEGARSLHLLRIPAGKFMMGSPASERASWESEKPAHQVTIDSDFYMGETEVTQAQWQAVMGTNPATALHSIGNDYPVYNVSWEDISQNNGFLYRLNRIGEGTFRLPSEAEWEYSCRSGRITRFYFGDSLECPDSCDDCAAGILPGNRSNYMWYCWNADPLGNKQVHGKLPNLFGLYDMHGSVNEWCEDYWHDNYLGAPTNGTPWLDEVGSNGYRVIRSGDWYSGASSCRSAYRFWMNPENRNGFLGFRLVRDVPAMPTPTYDPSQPTWTQTNTKTVTQTKTPTVTPSATSTPRPTWTPDPNFPLGQDIAGLWDFDSGNLSSTIGIDLSYRGNAGTATQFGMTTSFGIPDINGTPANVMRISPYPPSDGIEMYPGIEPNGGGTRVNQYSLIVDILYPSFSGGFRSIFQTDENNSNDGDFFIRDDGGIGISGDYDGNLTRDTWHRLAITFDLTTSTLMKYLDGVIIDSQTLYEGLDGRWSINPASSSLPTLLFSDDNYEVAEGYVNSLAILKRVLTPEEILQLGRPTADGFFPVLYTNPTPTPSNTLTSTATPQPAHVNDLR